MLRHFSRAGRSLNFYIRPIGESDVGSLRLLSQACPPLGLHTAFTYWVVAHFYCDYSFIAFDKNNEPAGYVICITKRDEPDLVYLWQIGVLPEHRRDKLAQELLETLYEKRIKASGITRLQVTITEENKPSNQLFRSFAERHGFKYRIVGEASVTDPIDGVAETEKLIEITVQ